MLCCVLRVFKPSSEAAHCLVLVVLEDSACISCPDSLTVACVNYSPCVLPLLSCRRDLAVLLLHAGQPAAAAAELSAYLDSVKGSLQGRAGLQQDPFDVRLAQELWKMLSESGVKPSRWV